MKGPTEYRTPIASVPYAFTERTETPLGCAVTHTVRWQKRGEQLERWDDYVLETPHSEASAHRARRARSAQ